jgi:hypothetical protein
MDFVLSRNERIQLIIERDGPNCFLCGDPFTKNQKITIDHWIPKAAGGTEDLENLRIAHKLCNVRKSDLVPQDDNTVPMRPPKPVKRKKGTLRSEIMARFCDVCSDGRELGKDDTCFYCGSPPGPPENPRYLKRNSKDCDHAYNWCWACSIGIVEKRPAMMELMTGG